MILPIRTSLTLIYCAVFCFSTVLLEFGAYRGLESSIYAVVDSELQARLGGVQGFLDEHVGRKTPADLAGEIASHAALKPEFLLVNRDGVGELFRGRSMPLLAPAHNDRVHITFSSTQNASIPLRILRARRGIRGHYYDLDLAEDLRVPATILTKFRWLVIISLPVVLACASIAGYFISKWALLPVSQLTNAARSIGASNLGERLTVPRSGDEIQALGETLNGMLVGIEGAFRHVTQFTANASHELRTPLALIRTTAEVALLRINGNSESYREALHRILSEAEKNTTLLDDLLRLARADAAKTPLALKPLEFGSHMGQICEQILPLAEERNIRLECHPPLSTLWVMADANHLRRLWLILLDNAIKYTGPGGAIVVSWRAAPEGLLVCEVRDTGIGIAQVDLPHIFERFYRADKARSREEGGAGLGLAMARWIVAAHQAAIDVESVIGQGSVFRVALALLNQPSTLQRASPTPSPGGLESDKAWAPQASASKRQAV